MKNADIIKFLMIAKIFLIMTIIIAQELIYLEENKKKLKILKILKK